MFDTLITVLAIVLVFIGLPALMLRMNDRRRAIKSRRDRPAASQIAERQQYEQRILNPDWTRVERHLQRPVPQALRDLYADRALIMRRDLGYAGVQVISTFEPLDQQAILEAASWPANALVIATTDFSDAIYLRTGAAEVDAVYLAHHDGGDTEVLAESVARLLAIVRQADGE